MVIAVKRTYDVAMDDISYEARVGAVVRGLRKSAGWSQNELAARLTSAGWQVKQNTIANLEGGKRPTTLTDLAALARIFGVRPSSLIQAVEDDSTVPEDVIEVQAGHVIARRGSVQSVFDSALRDLAEIKETAQDLVSAPEFAEFGAPGGSLESGRNLYIRQQVTKLAETSVSDVARGMIDSFEERGGGLYKAMKALDNWEISAKETSHGEHQETA